MNTLKIKKYTVPVLNTEYNRVVDALTDPQHDSRGKNNNIIDYYNVERQKLYQPYRPRTNSNDNYNKEVELNLEQLKNYPIDSNHKLFTKFTTGANNSLIDIDYANKLKQSRNNLETMTENNYDDESVFNGSTASSRRNSLNNDNSPVSSRRSSVASNNDGEQELTQEEEKEQARANNAMSARFRGAKTERKYPVNVDNLTSSLSTEKTIKIVLTKQQANKLQGDLMVAPSGNDKFWEEIIEKTKREDTKLGK